MSTNNPIPPWQPFVTTTPTARYTTRHLPATQPIIPSRLPLSPAVRAATFGAVVLFLVGATCVLWSFRQQANAATVPPVIILATAKPTMQPPTITPAPQPQVQELPSGAIVAWNGKEWQLLQPAPGQAQTEAQPAGKVEQPEQQIQVSYQAQQVEQQPEAQAQDAEQAQVEQPEATAAPAGVQTAQSATDAWIADVPGASSELLTYCASNAEAAKTVFCGGPGK